MVYQPGCMLTEDQRDALEELRPGVPAHEAANSLANEGHALFVQGLDFGATPTPMPAPIVRAEPEFAALPAVAPEPAPISDDGLELLGADDMVIPRLKLKQPMTQNADPVEEGRYFTSTDIDEGREVFTFSVFRVTPRYEAKLAIDEEKRWSQIERLERQVGRSLEIGDKDFHVCASDDRRLPNATIRVPLSPSCETCSMRTWQKVGKSNVRTCNEVYDFAIVDLDEMQPMLWTMRGSAVKAAKRLNTALKMASRRYGKGAHGVYFEARSERREGKAGHYYVPTFSRATQHQPDMIEDLNAMRAEFGGRSVAPDLHDDAGSE